MSIVAYNGITLPYPLTSNFSIDPLIDEVGKTDWFCSQYTIEVQCVIGLDYLRVIEPNLPAADAPSIMNGIKERLQQRRKTLSFKVNGVEQIPLRQQGLPATSTIDADNGPTPVYVRVIDLTYGNFLLSFKIQGRYWNNVDVTNNPNGPNQRSSDVLFSRWRETVEIDDRNYSKRTREGRYRIRSDNATGSTVDLYRNDLAVLSIPPGFVRKNSRYSVTPDGMELEYVIVDQEVYKLPPSPAFRARGHYSEETTRGGANRFCEVNIRLEGDKSVPQDTLVAICMNICINKLNINGAFLGVVPAGLPPPPPPPPAPRGGGRLPLIAGLAGLVLPIVGPIAPLLGLGAGATRVATGDGAVLEGAVIRVNMYDNVVEAKYRAFTGVTRDRINLVNRFRGGMTFTPLSNATQPAYRNCGTASLLLQAAAYWDPSVRNVVLGPGDIVAPVNPLTPRGNTAVQHTAGGLPGTVGLRPE